MRLNFFSRNPGEDRPSQDPENDSATPPRPETGKSFPADEVVWGITIRNGFDEIDDPWHHQGTTQHAYLEGNDNVAICGFRPPQSGPRTRRRSRLGLPTPGTHPMCGMCARMVVAPRPRVPIPIQPEQAPVAVPVAAGGEQPPPRMMTPQTPVAAGVPVAAETPVAENGAGSGPVGSASVSPWVQQRSAGPDEPSSISIDMTGTHDAGLLERGVNTQVDD